MKTVEWTPLTDDSTIYLSRCYDDTEHWAGSGVAVVVTGAPFRRVGITIDYLHMALPLPATMRFGELREHISDATITRLADYANHPSSPRSYCPICNERIHGGDNVWYVSYPDDTRRAHGRCVGIPDAGMIAMPNGDDEDLFSLHESSSRAALAAAEEGK